MSDRSATSTSQFVEATIMTIDAEERDDLECPALTAFKEVCGNWEAYSSQVSGVGGKWRTANNSEPHWGNRADRQETGQLSGFLPGFYSIRETSCQCTYHLSISSATVMRYTLASSVHQFTHLHDALRFGRFRPKAWKNLVPQQNLSCKRRAHISYLLLLFMLFLPTVLAYI